MPQPDLIRHLNARLRARPGSEGDDHFELAGVREVQAHFRGRIFRSVFQPQIRRGGEVICHEAFLQVLARDGVGASPQTIFEQAGDDDAIALDRIVTAEVERFPELGRILYDFAVPRAVGTIEKILNQACADGTLDRIDTHHAAEHFLYAVIVGPMRMVALGVEGRRLSGGRLKRLRQSIDLFLNGVRSRSD